MGAAKADAALAAQGGAQKLVEVDGEVAFSVLTLTLALTLAPSPDPNSNPNPNPNPNPDPNPDPDQATFSMCSRVKTFCPARNFGRGMVSLTLSLTLTLTLTLPGPVEP